MFFRILLRYISNFFLISSFNFDSKDNFSIPWFQSISGIRVSEPTKFLFARVAWFSIPCAISVPNNFNALNFDPSISPMVDGAYGMSTTITQEVLNPLAGLSNSYSDNKTDKLICSNK